MKTIYELTTGKALTVEAIDAKEILKHSPDLYSEVKPESHVDAPEAPAAEVYEDRKLTIAQLRETLTVRGVAFEEGAKKSELQALLDAHYAAG